MALSSLLLLPRSLSPHSISFTRTKIAPTAIRFRNSDSATRNATFHLKVYKDDDAQTPKLSSFGFGNVDSGTRNANTLHPKARESTGYVQIMLPVLLAMLLLATVSGGFVWWGVLFFVIGVMTGLQPWKWKEIAREIMKGRLVKRIEKLKENIRVLENRFRITDHILQEDSEATENLERKVRETLKLLIATKEHERKQLDLLRSMAVKMGIQKKI